MLAGILCIKVIDREIKHVWMINRLLSSINIITKFVLLRIDCSVQKLGIIYIQLIS